MRQFGVALISVALLCGLSRCDRCSGLEGGGACCDDWGNCTETSERACGGEWHIDKFCTEVICYPQLGACCLHADGRCDERPERACGVEGTFLGLDRDCDPNPCFEGACCEPGGGCAITMYYECPYWFAGADTTCDGDACSRGACCGATGSCEMTTEDECENTFLGAATSCDPNPCDMEIGACCDGAGNCFELPPEDCGGDFLGVGVACTPTLCYSGAGACCLLGYGSDVECTVVVEEDCPGTAAEAGVFLGEGRTCDPDPCVPQACCGGATGTECEMVLPWDCLDGGGRPMGDGTDCSDPGICATAGACCDAETESCDLELPSECIAPTQAFHFGVDSCDPSPCDFRTGACCDADGTCSVGYTMLCEGTFVGGSCDPDPCAEGACCDSGGGCTITAGYDCSDWFVGPGTTCGAGTCTPTTEDCDDGLDNDGDGATDCDDDDCSSTTLCLPESDCRDGVDDDGDGYTDCDDYGCALSALCLPEGDCTNGLDDDGDGDTDCVDDDCWGLGGCPGADDCDDGVDNDRDGRTDCDDDECWADATCPAVAEDCTNGLDDDHDYLFDCADLDCAAASGCDGCTAGVEWTCGDGSCVDDTFLCDGFADCPYAEDEFVVHCGLGPESCFNTVDDDGDRRADCDDLDCAGSPGCCGCDLTTEFPCMDCSCIALSLACDGTPHCAGGEDELGCYVEDCFNTWDDDWDELVDCRDPDCATETHCMLCGAGEFTCGSGECIDASGYCNRVYDCADGTDEDMTCPTPPAEPR